MAVDTAQKRFSLMGFGCPVPQMVMPPSGSVVEADRADLLYLYSGITLTEQQPEPEVDAPPPGGGKGAKKYRKPGGKWPRRVSIDGQVYTVRNPQELQDLLELLLERKREELAALEAQEATPEPQARKVRVVIRRTEQRLEAAQDEAEQWMARLREYDNELIALLAH